MVASRKTKKVFCTLVRVPANDVRNNNTANRFSTRPSDLVPWADPYIARLVHRLQDEVRNERATWTQKSSCHTAQDLRADLDPPSPVTDSDGGIEDTRWATWDDLYSDSPE